MITTFFASVSSLSAQEVIITYESGKCEVDLYGSGKWVDVSVDMELESKSIIRTGDNGELELIIDNNTVSIGQNRQIMIDDLLNKINEKKKIRWLKKATKYTKAIGIRDDSYSRTALAGVRGEKSEEEELEWFDDFGEEREFQSGKELFEEGKFTEAINIFSKIIAEEGIETEGGEVAYYLGISLFNSLRYKDAIPYLVESLKDKSAPYYESALMNYAFTQYFLGDYNNAIEGFNNYIKDFGEGDLKPYALLMLGKCYKDIGKKVDALIYFTKIEKEYKNTDVYIDAIEEMKGL